ncbi:MAG: hypothetical protein AAB354_13955 [candidate division KSB1 bacterium]
MKPMRLSAHALGYVHKRGFTAAEVETALLNSAWQTAPSARLECRYNFSFGQVWNGRFYTTKQVRPVFVEKEEELVVVTVYTNFF